MTPIENLHYALGEMAYAVARADGNVQNEERKKFHDIVVSELGRHHYDFDISEIIFRMMDKDKMDPAVTYKWAMGEINRNSQYLSPELKKIFVCVMEKVAEAFPPVTPNERKVIDRFKKDIEFISGDPIFYETV